MTPPNLPSGEEIGMENIKRYFTLTERQAEQFAQLGVLYPDWNEKINLISRKDIDNLYEHHILHSLAIEKILHFAPGTRIMDVGTGGGFPGIPLAILFPDCHFILIDSIRKKVGVAEAIAREIGLTNVECRWERMEEETEKVDFIVSRAVMPLPDLVKLVRKNVTHEGQHNALPNGLIVLKGGGLDAEIRPFKNIVEVTDLSTIYPGLPWYKEQKKAIYMPL